MKKPKILVLGYFGYQNNQLDGQTIKTRNVYNLLKLKASEIGEVRYFDTQIFQYNKFAFIKLLWKILLCNKLIYLPAQNSLKYIFPFIYILSKIKSFSILYIVVGGWLYEYLENKSLHRYCLNRIEGVFTESDSLKNKLLYAYHFNNVVTFPNFRIHNFVPTFTCNDSVFKIVFMARLNRMKGIDTVFLLAEYVKQFADISIDFYGPIAEEDEEYFRSQLRQYPAVAYFGVLEPDTIYTILTQYDVMVLPTKYYTEGFPGSILDAYIAGIPVIATEWKHAKEFIEAEISGYIVPFINGEQKFIEAILRLYKDRDLLKVMRKNAYNKSKEYSAKAAWKILEPYILS
jgi:glycosyltransferase involved in cell wall biosynthesis